MVPMPPSKHALVRPLYAWEIQEARRVFGNHIAYHRVRIHENTAWPDTINILGAKLKGWKPKGKLPKGKLPVIDHNAITLGNHIYFPVRLLQNPNELQGPQLYLFTWLVHELTHVWQYQQMGWRYLPLALHVQFSLGARAYDFGGEAGLLDIFEKGGKLEDFNLEQQGDIARAYYYRLAQGRSVSAWQPFVDHFHHTA